MKSKAKNNIPETSRRIIIRWKVNGNGNRKGELMLLERDDGGNWNGYGSDGKRYHVCYSTLYNPEFCEVVQVEQPTDETEQEQTERQNAVRSFFLRAIEKIKKNKGDIRI